MSNEPTDRADDQTATANADDAASDDTTTDASSNAATDNSEPMSEHDTDESIEQSEAVSDTERYVRYAMLAGFTILALIALLRFYFAASEAINTWVSHEYRSLFQAAFNLVVLLIAGVGISWQVRELK